MLTIRHIHVFDHQHNDDAYQEILNKLNLIYQQNLKIMTDLTGLIQEVGEITTVAESAIALLNGLKQKLDEAGTDAVKLAELSAQLDLKGNELAAAVAANTPAENEPPV